MSWTMNSGLSEEDIVRWEDFINTISFPGSKVSFLCQYNRRTLPGDLVANAVHVHPVVVLGQDICPNRYYCSSTDALASPSTNLEPLLTDIKSLTLREATS